MHRRFPSRALQTLRQRVAVLTYVARVIGPAQRLKILPAEEEKVFAYAKSAAARVAGPSQIGHFLQCHIGQPGVRRGLVTLRSYCRARSCSMDSSATSRKISACAPRGRRSAVAQSHTTAEAVSRPADQPG